MEISVVCANASGALITGAAASTALKIRRVSDGYLLDWDDLTFKVSGWGHNSTALLEVDATNFPGEYRKAVVITAWIDGFYQAMVHFDDATTVLNFSGEKYIQGGREVDMNLDAAVSTRAPESGGNVAAIKTRTDNLPSDPASNTQVTTRLAASGYTAPDNTGIGAIKAKTDNLPAVPADGTQLMELITAKTCRIYSKSP